MEYFVEPWEHQRTAICRAIPRNNFALFFEAGSGKSGTTINILRHIFNERKTYLRTLIFCPPVVVSNWKDEFLKHSKIEPGKITLLKGPGSRRLKLFNKYSADSGHIFVTNYETLLMHDLFIKFQAWNPEVLIFDESHKIKEQRSKRTKHAILLANGMTNKKTKEVIYPPAKYRYILSGTPILNSAMDIFSQYWALDGGETFGTNFFAFRATYFRDKNAGMPQARYFPNWVLKPGALEQIKEKIKDSSMRVEKKDCMDLPPLVTQTIKVGMLPEQVRMYNEMAKDLLTFVENKGEMSPVVANMALTKSLRLLQITAGFTKTVEGKVVGVAKTPKAEALKELLEELTPNHKVIVWVVWKENYDQVRKICEELGIDSVEIHGEVSDAARTEGIERFNTDPSCRVLFGHPKSGGIGINLVVASYSIFYSRSYSLEDSLQAEARNHRGGSEIHEKITRINLVCEGTIDELVEKALAQKIEIGEKVFRSEVLHEIKKQLTQEASE